MQMYYIKKEKRGFYSRSLYADKRIGAHNEDAVSVLVGNLLGDGYGERRGDSSRFQVHVSSRNMEYVSWLHNFFASRGYCSTKKAAVKRQIGRHNQIYYSVAFKSFSFKSLNYLYDLFYVDGKKVVPPTIENLLTEKALAVWLMNHGVKSGDGLNLSTESFSIAENLLLQRALKHNFSIEPTIQRHSDKWLLYFKKKDVPALFKRVKGHVLPCMYYKFFMGNTKP